MHAIRLEFSVIYRLFTYGIRDIYFNCVFDIFCYQLMQRKLCYAVFSHLLMLLLVDLLILFIFQFVMVVNIQIAVEWDTRCRVW